MSKFIKLTNKSDAFFVNSCNIVEFGRHVQGGSYFVTVSDDGDGYRLCDQTPAEIMAKIREGERVDVYTESLLVKTIIEWLKKYEPIEFCEKLAFLSETMLEAKRKEVRSESKNK